MSFGIIPILTRQRCRGTGRGGLRGVGRDRGSGHWGLDGRFPSGARGGTPWVVGRHREYPRPYCGGERGERTQDSSGTGAGIGTFVVGPSNDIPVLIQEVRWLDTLSTACRRCPLCALEVDWNRVGDVSGTDRGADDPSVYKGLPDPDPACDPSPSPGLRPPVVPVRTVPPGSTSPKPSVRCLPPKVGGWRWRPDRLRTGEPSSRQGPNEGTVHHSDAVRGG